SYLYSIGSGFGGSAGLSSVAGFSSGFASTGFLPSAAGKKRSEEHTSELQSLTNLVCRLLLEKKKKDALAMRSRPNFDRLAGRRYRGDGGQELQLHVIGVATTVRGMYGSRHIRSLPELIASPY